MTKIPPKTESVAKALMINHQNEVLILTIGEHRTQPSRSFQPDLPGGMVDSGETEKEAVVREIYEEIGVEVSDEAPQLVYTKTEYIDRSNASVSKFLYLIFLDHIPEVTLSWEHSAYKWVPVGELQEHVDLRPFYNEAVDYCLEHSLLNR